MEDFPQRISLAIPRGTICRWPISQIKLSDGSLWTYSLLRGEWICSSDGDFCAFVAHQSAKKIVTLIKKREVIR